MTKLSVLDLIPVTSLNLIANKDLMASSQKCCSTTSPQTSFSSGCSDMAKTLFMVFPEGRFINQK